MAQVDDILEAFELDHNQHSDTDDSSVSSEIEENQHNLCHCSDDNELDYNNDCDADFEQEAEAEITNVDSNEELVINIQD